MRRKRVGQINQKREIQNLADPTVPNHENQMKSTKINQEIITAIAVATKRTGRKKLEVVSVM
jgi:hypothetical protein